MSPIALYDRGTAVLSRFEFLPALIARLTVGWVFVESGWGKVHNLEKVTEYFQSLGIPAASIQAPFAAGSELVFGALVLVGLFTRISTVPLMIIMVIAILTAKRDELHGISDLLGFIEYLYIVLLAWLFVHGPGAISVDRVLTALRGGKPTPMKAE